MDTVGMEYGKSMGIKKEQKIAPCISAGGIIDA